MHIYIYVYIYICIFIYVYVYIYIYMNTCIHKHTHTHTYVYIYVYIYIYLHAYIYIYIYIYICVYIYVCIHIHMYIHTYIYTYITFECGVCRCRRGSCGEMCTYVYWCTYIYSITYIQTCIQCLNLVFAGADRASVEKGATLVAAAVAAIKKVFFWDFGDTHMHTHASTRAHAYIRTHTYACGLLLRGRECSLEWSRYECNFFEPIWSGMKFMHHVAHKQIDLCYMVYGNPSSTFFHIPPPRPNLFL